MRGGSKGLGTAVNETVVLCVVALYAVNVVLTTIGAVLTLGETPTIALIVGSLIVVLAVALIGGDRVRGGGRSDVVGLFLAGLAACLWASSGLLLGQGLRLLDPIATNMIRFPVAAIVFTAYVAAVRPSEVLTRRLAALSVVAAIGTLASASLFLPEEASRTARTPRPPTSPGYLARNSVSFAAASSLRPIWNSVQAVCEAVTDA